MDDGDRLSDKVDVQDQGRSSLPVVPSSEVKDALSKLNGKKSDISSSDEKSALKKIAAFGEEVNEDADVLGQDNNTNAKREHS